MVWIGAATRVSGFDGDLEDGLEESFAEVGPPGWLRPVGEALFVVDLDEVGVTSAAKTVPPEMTGIGWNRIWSEIGADVN